VQVALKPGKDRALRRRHPWVFSGAIASVKGNPQSGDVVDVVDAKGHFLGRGAFSPSSQIRVRMWTFADPALVVDDALIAARVAAAVSLRKRLVLRASTTCARLVFAEGDGLPGLVADLYDDVLVFQCQSAGAERVKAAAVDALVKESGARVVVERSDAEVRKLEGLVPTSGVLRGTLPAELRVLENGARFHVDVERGHKTGFYLDQRDARLRVRELSAGRRVLNCFSYTGGFSVNALLGGAVHATSVDSSMPALEICEKNVRANEIAEDRHEGVKGDCFDVLRGMKGEGERFDMVILDPPKLAPKAAHLEKAARAYGELAFSALQLLNSGGLLVTFSCSGAVTREHFVEITAAAALGAGRDLRILQHLGHSVDHPVGGFFPEGEYLKGLVCAV
jgi:23S rRNA (cytosine1962-C5)-methyltransferase